MVLNDPNNPPPDSGFQDAPPQSDSDRYDEFNQANIQRYEGAPLPRPFPGTQLLGFTDARLAKIISHDITQAQQILGRPPTVDEASALAFWSAKKVATLSYGSPVGIGFGLAQAYRTAATFRFPFFKPDPEKFNPRAFPTARVAWATGDMAAKAWHVMRAAAYGAVGNYVGTILFASYATSIMAVGMFSDKRLKDYIQAVKLDQRNSNKAIPERPQSPVAPGGPMKPAGQASGDDGSPTSDATWLGSNDSPSNDGFLGASAPRESEYPSPRPTGTAPQKGPQSVSVDKEPANGSAVFDDASPTGGVGVTDEMASGESAWERIRRQGSSGMASQQGSSWQSRQQSQTDAPVQYGWGNGAATEGNQGSSKSANGQLSAKEAREAAQREFDEQVERERRGESFSGRG